MMTWNGYKPGESRTTKHRARKADAGHSVVATTTTLTPAYRWRYKVVCQCGKTYTGRTTDTPFQTLERHRRKEAQV
jgi:hypothetical protein